MKPFRFPSGLRINFLLICFLPLLLLPPLGCRPIIALGKNPSGEALKKIETLPNYKNGQFQNLESPPTDNKATALRRLTWTRLLKYFIAKKPKGTRPAQTLPSALTNLKSNPPQKPTVIWFGHSSFLLKTATANLLFDPVFNEFAGPLPGMITAFAGSNVYGLNDLPLIDAIVISHDHYDHLDYNTVRKLRKKVKRVIVPIGVGSHFRRWGYKPEQITELNWNDSVRLTQSVTVTAAPAYHRSNRTMAARKTLWASYVIKADGFKIYFSGDTGYSGHFKRIGEQHGPFDLALLECGQYNTKWPQSHMFPHQTAKASLDLQAAVILPVHWSKFAESEHPWNEPVARLLTSADSLGIRVSVPLIGQPYAVGNAPLRYRWWAF